MERPHQHSFVGERLFEYVLAFPINAKAIMRQENFTTTSSQLDAQITLVRFSQFESSEFRI